MKNKLIILAIVSISALTIAASYTISRQVQDIRSSAQYETNLGGDLVEGDGNGDWRSCPLSDLSNQCYRVIRCERAGSGRPGDSTCFRYISYQCLPDGRIRTLNYPSRCRTLRQAKAELEKICNCSPTATPTSIEAPKSTPQPTPYPTAKKIPQLCSKDQCLYPCQIYEDSTTCSEHTGNGCSWCESSNTCIITTEVDYCDTEGNHIIRKPYEKCE